MKMVAEKMMKMKVQYGRKLQYVLYIVMSTFITMYKYK